MGLSSYCLIIFYQNKKRLNRGIITLLINRIGDINILIIIRLLINKNSLNFLFFNKLNLFLIIFIFITALTKRAQIPFSIWLPLAIAAPTPVSSLVHSSTLVTAGIYLIIRFNYLFNRFILLIIIIIALWTIILARLRAIFEYDFKKIIALSTLSQLAIILLTISFKQIELRFFHLISHAIFKSLLFLCSGIIIHNYFNNQDIRYISLINKNFPSIIIIFNTASLTLCGLPFLRGFYSKDLIIEIYLINNINYYIFNIILLCIILTVIYRFRLIFYIRIKPLKTYTINKFKINNLINQSIYILFLLSIIYGSIINWLIFNSLNLTILKFNLKIIIFNLLLISLIIIIILILKIFSIKKINIFIYYFFNNIWLFNNFLKLNKFNLIKFNNILNYKIENQWLEYFSSKKLNFIFKYINNINYILNIFIILIICSYIFIFFIYLI